MREIIYTIETTKEKVVDSVGIKVKLKVNRGRNKIELIEGIVENAYPNIFTIRKDNGALSTFSYADIISKNVKFV